MKNIFLVSLLTTLTSLVGICERAVAQSTPASPRICYIVGSSGGMRNVYIGTSAKDAVLVGQFNRWSAQTAVRMATDLCVELTQKGLSGSTEFIASDEVFFEKRKN